MRFKSRYLALALAATAMTVSSVAAPTAAMAASKGGKKEGGKYAPFFGECNTVQWILVAPLCLVAEYVNKEDTPPPPPPKPKPKPKGMGDGDGDWDI